MSESEQEPTEIVEQAEPEKVFTQAEVDRIVSERLRREDVKGLKAKAAEYDRLADAQKTAEQRAAEALAQAESKARDAEALAIRYQVAAQYGITKDDADLFLLGSDIDTIKAQAERLTERDGQRRKQGNYVPTEGKTPAVDGTDPIREFTRGLFGGAQN